MFFWLNYILIKVNVIFMIRTTNGVNCFSGYVENNNNNFVTRFHSQYVTENNRQMELKLLFMRTQQYTIILNFLLFVCFFVHFAFEIIF